MSWANQGHELLTTNEQFKTVNLHLYDKYYYISIIAGQVETTCLNTRQTCSYSNLQDYLKSIRDIKNVKIQKIARSQTGHGVYVVNLTSNDEEEM